MPTLAERVQNLETEIAILRETILAAKANGAKDWQRSIGAFTEDEGMRKILNDAMKLREADRKKARVTKSRQPRLF